MTGDEAARLQATIDRLALELAEERREHRRTAEERDEALAAARSWRRVAQIIHEANRATDDTAAVP